jgi:hypothetical protein
VFGRRTVTASPVRKRLAERRAQRFERRGQHAEPKGFAIDAAAAGLRRTRVARAPSVLGLDTETLRDDGRIAVRMAQAQRQRILGPAHF